MGKQAKLLFSSNTDGLESKLVQVEDRGGNGGSVGEWTLREVTGQEREGRVSG